MSTRDLVNAIISGQANEVEDALNSTLMNKIADRLEDMKSDIGQTMFSNLGSSDSDVYESYLYPINEKLSTSDPVSSWIKDFQESDAPQFEGKSREDRRKMALAAWYSSKRSGSR